MPNPDQWLKLHTSLLASEKFTSLPHNDHKWAFICLMMLCKKRVITPGLKLNRLQKRHLLGHLGLSSRRWKSVSKVLFEAGLIDEHFYVNGFENSQITPSAIRMRRHRERHSDATSDTLCDDRREKRDKNPYIPLEKSARKPRKKSKKVKDSDVSDVLAYLNARTGRNVGVTGMIEKRLANGGTVEMMKKVIDLKAEHWMGDDKMFRYLHPDTLFNKAKYAKYSDEVAEARLEDEQIEFL